MTQNIRNDRTQHSIRYSDQETAVPNTAGSFIKMHEAGVAGKVEKDRAVNSRQVWLSAKSKAVIVMRDGRI